MVWITRSDNIWALLLSPANFTVTCRLNTDIQFGLNFGMKTILVFTGATSREDMMSGQGGGTKPHYVADSIAGFLTCL